MVEINGLRSMLYHRPMFTICGQSWESPHAQTQDSPPRHTSGVIIQQIDLVMGVRSAV